jgi:GYF domain 2
MEKVWYIEVEGKREGPFSIAQLKRDKRITPDTLVWKKSFSTWIPIRNVPELKIIFEDSPIQEVIKPVFDKKKLPLNEIAIDFREDPPFFYLWLIIAATIASYILYELFWR